MAATSGIAGCRGHSVLASGFRRPVSAPNFEVHAHFVLFWQQAKRIRMSIMAKLLRSIAI
ncbi:hypothetical protein [Ancylobacter pratisalsi]|uniref:Uncharacterized protein n=1 Tax=Ancylobacter pratisalsi TaxID=1745854 RepID=A0A6P1YKK5_9HYPH|nr:hypothetical protein [Ancylobacter pratisalsi]QIB32753.1 hypothetical protein G3A50_02800 [Ancylobacter pratisalsi]